MKDKVKVQEIVIDGTIYVPKESLPQAAERDGMPYVCIRTYSAGVHCGYLKSREGKEAVLLDSIRIWQWSGAATLSQLAMQGVNNPDSCKFAMPISTDHTLTEVIEVISMTEEAMNNIKNIKSWKK
jgi:hypothetical protein